MNNRMNNREYMVHRPSGEVYVMEFALNEPIAMLGPCYRGDLATVRMDDWNLEQDDLDWAAGESWAVCDSQQRNLSCGYPATVCECPMPSAAAARWAESKQIAHRKRNKSGHTFDQDLHGAPICKCGLSAYDWKCTWLWS